MTPEPVFRCCGLPKTPANTGYRVLYGRRQPYCRACRNARERRYRKANRAKVNAWAVRQRLRKQGIAIPTQTPIPRADWLRLAGMQADLLASSPADKIWAEECLEQLVTAYQLGAERRRLGREKEREA